MHNFEKGQAMKYSMDHIVLNVQDVEKMIAFYTEIMMSASERLEEYRTGEKCHFRDPEDNLIKARYYEGSDNSDKCLLGS
jgi:predicted enzyme related to lactoylglutathione lyase